MTPRRWLLVAVSFLAGVDVTAWLLTKKPPVEKKAALDVNLEAIGLRCATLANAERVSQGLRELWAVDNLGECARIRAGQAALANSIEHRTAEHPDIDEYLVLLKAMAVPIATAGENTGRLSATAADPAGDMHRAWMSSEQHRNHILGQEFTRIGAGVANSNDGRLYFAVIFSREQQDG